MKEFYRSIFLSSCNSIHIDKKLSLKDTNPLFSISLLLVHIEGNSCKYALSSF